MKLRNLSIPLDLLIVPSAGPRSKSEVPLTDHNEIKLLNITLHHIIRCARVGIGQHPRLKDNYGISECVLWAQEMTCL